MLRVTGTKISMATSEDERSNHSHGTGTAKNTPRSSEEAHILAGYPTYGWLPDFRISLLNTLRTGTLNI
jgi:hypothetical protein